MGSAIGTGPATVGRERGQRGGCRAGELHRERDPVAFSARIRLARERDVGRLAEVTRKPHDRRAAAKGRAKEPVRALANAVDENEVPVPLGQGFRALRPDEYDSAIVRVAEDAQFSRLETLT